MDISKTIIPKSDQLNADDLISGAKTITIRDIKAGSDDAQPVNVYFQGDNNKPYKPCKSMRRLLVQIWGADASKYIGRKLTLYRDDSVLFAGVAVGGIRISHASHIDSDLEVLITTAKGKRRPTLVKSLKMDVLDEKHELFESIKTAILEGKRTIEQIEQKFIVSDEVKILLTNNTQNND